jgi:hypothetical protein
MSAITPIRLAATAVLSFMLASCSWKNTPADQHAPTTPKWLGTIRMVNTPDRFVLIETASSVPPGSECVAIRDLAETATLRTTALRNHPFLIADITGGSPAPGDRVAISQPTPTGNPSNDTEDR